METRCRTYLVILLAAFSLSGFSQTIAYSNETIPFRETDHTIIIGNFGNMLHVLKEEKWGNKELLIYDSAMTLVTRKTLQQEPEGFGDVQIISYPGFYYLFFTNQAEKKQRVLKINTSGEYEDKTKELREQLALRFDDNNVRGSFRKVEDRIFFVTSRYDRLKDKMFLSVLNFDSLFSNNLQHLLITDINNKEDIINDIVFADTGSVYIMKSFRKGSDRFGEIEIVRYNLNTGTDKAIVFTGGEDVFYEPRLRYNYDDSALLFFAMVRNKRSDELTDLDFKCHYVKLDEELKEIASPLKVNITPKGKERVMLITHDQRLSVLDNSEFLYNYYPDFSPMPLEQVFYFGEGPPLRKPGYGYSLERKPEVLWIGPGRSNTNRKRVDLDMRIIWVDDRNIDRTVLLKSKKGRRKSEFFNYFLLKRDHELMLLYATGFSLFRNGISYLFLNNGTVSEEELLRVNERYDYLLTSAKQLGEATIVFPYVYKERLGLIKLSF